MLECLMLYCIKDEKKFMIVRKSVDKKRVFIAAGDEGVIIFSSETFLSSQYHYN